MKRPQAAYLQHPKVQLPPFLREARQGERSLRSVDPEPSLFVLLTPSQYRLRLAVWLATGIAIGVILGAYVQDGAATRREQARIEQGA